MGSGLVFLFLSSWLIAFSGALMPGPLLSLTLAESSRPGGWKAGFLLITGHGVLEMILLIILFAGLAPLVRHPGSFVVVALAGSLFMLFMAFGMFRSLPNLRIEGMDKGGTERKRFLPLSGALMSLANPYWLIWWATIGFGYVLVASEKGFPGVAAFFLGHILADYCWYVLVSIAVNRSRKILPLTVYRIMIAACALFLVLYSGFLLYRGIRALLPLI